MVSQRVGGNCARLLLLLGLLLPISAPAQSSGWAQSLGVGEELRINDDNGSGQIVFWSGGRYSIRYTPYGGSSVRVSGSYRFIGSRTLELTPDERSWKPITWTLTERVGRELRFRDHNQPGNAVRIQGTRRASPPPPPPPPPVRRERSAPTSYAEDRLALAVAECGLMHLGESECNAQLRNELGAGFSAMTCNAVVQKLGSDSVSGGEVLLSLVAELASQSDSDGWRAAGAATKLGLFIRCVNQRR